MAAQAGFGDFLKRFPNHALVPNALYWLGETYYVQKNYADAAEAFDIVLSAHGNSNKAPDSQLKKAMSLSQQGKNADACSALRQLATKFPNAPSHVKIEGRQRAPPRRLHLSMSTAEPIRDDELAGLFAKTLTFPIALAVSGGPDSVALLHLVHRWMRQSGAREAVPTAVTTLSY